MKHINIEKVYCEKCHQDTEHEVLLVRDARQPPSSFTEAESEGYASDADCIFYANGDSEYEYCCRECGRSYSVM